MQRAQNILQQLQVLPPSLTTRDASSAPAMLFVLLLLLLLLLLLPHCCIRCREIVIMRICPQTT
jgi:hypothetical protein